MRIVLIACASICATGAALAGDAKTEKKVVVEEKTVVCSSEGSAAPVCKVTTTGPDGTTVEELKDGKSIDKKVIVMRRHRLDGADTDGDGAVSKAEFMAHAEKHFAEMDRDKNGQLSKEETVPPMPAGMEWEQAKPHGHAH